MSLLFAYGTLQRPDIQMQCFGRTLEGRPDALPGYTRGAIPITDPEQIELLGGETHYAAVEPSPTPDAEVGGTVYEVTDDDLRVADQYEQDADYRRELLTLKSGERAWVYLR